MTHRSLFQKPQKFRAVKYLNPNAWKSQFQVCRKQPVSRTLHECNLLHVDASMTRTDNQSSLLRRTPMKQSARVSKSPSNLSNLFHQRLNMYALAASGVGALALTQPAEA